MIHRLRPRDESYIGDSKEEHPYEIHLISFPTDEDFKGYLQDSKRTSFNQLKDESLRCSYIYKGEKL